MESLWPQLEKRFWPKGYRQDIWMIVDSSRQQDIFGKLLDSHLDLSCLYSRLIHPGLEVVAPYLVRLEFEDTNTRRFVEAAWGNSWGVFLRCDVGLQKTRRQLRTLLTVRGPGGEKLLFRYYDPRVLRTYLPTCFPQELLTVFGPIECFWAEDETGEKIIGYEVVNNRLQTTLSEIR